MNARIKAGSEDRDDVLVMQKAGRLRLHLKAMTMPRIQRRRGGKHLEGDSSSKRNLLGLEDNTHPAMTNLTNEAKLSQLRRWREIREPVLPGLDSGEVARCILDELETIKAFGQRDGNRPVTSQEVLPPRRPARPPQARVFLECCGDLLIF